MKTVVSSKGQIVLPAPLRFRLGIQEGDTLDIEPGDGWVLLRTEKPAHKKAKIKFDPVTGLPALSAGKKAVPLKSSTVESILSDFP